jgi:hypothetical protein
MTKLKEPTDPTLAVADRRRANRRDYDNPHLIALLREKPPEQMAHIAASTAPYDGFDDNDHLAPARGIGLTVLLSIPLWGALAAAIWMVWRFL